MMFIIWMVILTALLASDNWIKKVPEKRIPRGIKFIKMKSYLVWVCNRYDSQVSMFFFSGLFIQASYARAMH